MNVVHANNLWTCFKVLGSRELCGRMVKSEGTLEDNMHFVSPR